MKTAAAYIRVSTEDQIEFSPDSQIKAIREYAKRNDIILPEEFIFMDEGISGRNVKKRPAFNEMIGLAKTKPAPFEVLLLWKFSRFARNQEESIVYKSLLKKLGIAVVSVSEPIIDGPFGDLIERIIEWSDEYYSINLSQEVKRGMTEKAQRGGVVSSPPFGYKMGDDIFEIDEPNAKIVKMLFDDFLAGMGYRDLACKLNDMGVCTKRGNKWDNRGVEYLLRNSVYIGKLHWNPNKKIRRDYSADGTIESDGNHKPIIDVGAFNRVQKIIQDKKHAHQKYERSQAADFMLKGVVRCGSCGATLVKSVGNSLQCHKYAKGQCSVSHSISIPKLTEFVLTTIQNDIKNNNFHISSRQLENTALDSDFNRALLERERKKLERVKTAYEDGIDTIDEYRANKAKIQKRISEIEKTIKPKVDIDTIRRKLSNKANVGIKILKNDSVDESEKNIILKSFVESIVFHRPDNTIDIIYY